MIFLFFFLKEVVVIITVMTMVVVMMMMMAMCIRVWGGQRTTSLLSPYTGAGLLAFLMSEFSGTAVPEPAVQRPRGENDGHSCGRWRRKWIFLSLFLCLSLCVCMYSVRRAEMKGEIIVSSGACLSSVLGS